MALRDSNYTVALATTTIPLVGGYPDPDDVGITWEGLEIRRDFGAHFGGSHLLINFDDYIGASPGANTPPLAVGPKNLSGQALLGVANGAQTQLLQAPEAGIPISMAVQHPAVGDWTDTKTHAQLITALTALIPDAATVTALQANFDDATGTIELEAGEVAAAGLVKGMVLDIIIDGVTRKRTIVKIDGEVCTIHPRIGLDPGISSVFQIRTCVTYLPVLAEVTDTVDLRMDVNGLSHYALGCTLQGLTFTEDADSSSVLMVAAMRPRNRYIFVGPNAGETTYPATPLSTPPANRMQACFTTTAALATPNATPTTLAPIGMSTLQGWQFDVAFSATYGEACTGPYNEGPPTITRADATYTGETNQVDPFAGMIMGREQRTYTLDFGPTGDGMALIMYAGFLPDTEGKTEDATIREQRRSFTLSNGTFTGEDGGTGASWALAIPLEAV